MEARRVRDAERAARNAAAQNDWGVTRRSEAQWAAREREIAADVEARAAALAAEAGAAEVVRAEHANEVRARTPASAPAPRSPSLLPPALRLQAAAAAGPSPLQHARLPQEAGAVPARPRARAHALAPPGSRRAGRRAPAPRASPPEFVHSLPQTCLGTCMLPPGPRRTKRRTRRGHHVAVPFHHADRRHSPYSSRPSSVSLTRRAFWSRTT